MNCPSPEQLAAIALGLDDVPAAQQHIEQCSACRHAVAQLGQLSDQLATVHAPLDVAGETTHDAARERLLASLPTAPPAAQSVNPIRRFLSRFGGLTMKQRIAFGGASVAVALVLVTLSLVSTPQPALAMERLAASLREATSYSVDMIFEVQFVAEPGKPPVKSTTTSSALWRAPSSYRMETKGGKHNFSMDTIDVFSADQPGIRIDHKAKTYARQPARRGGESPLMVFEALSQYAGEADRDLGTKKIDDRSARGFVIDAKKIDADGQPGVVEIWIDNQSNLPVIVRLELTTNGVPVTMRLENFRWNIELADELFEPMPPEGYTDATREPPGLEELTKSITDGLRFYAKLSGGHYPRVKTVYGDVIRDEMLKLSGIAGQPTSEQMRSEEYAAIMKATIGMGSLTQLFRNNSDISYHGLTVDADDKDAVLLRWQLDDGRYQVIYGSLRSKTIADDKDNKPADLIVGKWQDRAVPDDAVIEFIKGGTGTITETTSEGSSQAIISWEIQRSFGNAHILFIEYENLKPEGIMPFTWLIAFDGDDTIIFQPAQNKTVIMDRQ